MTATTKPSDMRDAIARRLRGFQPEAGTRPEKRLRASIVASNHSPCTMNSEVQMSAPPFNNAMPIGDVLRAALERRRAVMPSRIDAAPDRPGSVGMYDYAHPDHPVNRAHAPDRMAQLQCGEHARPAERQARSRSRR